MLIAKVNTAYIYRLYLSKKYLNRRTIYQVIVDIINTIKDF